MKILGSVITEQDITFVIVQVKYSIINSELMRDNIMKMLRKKFVKDPIILMSKDIKGRPTFWGREDIVKYLSKVQVNEYKWKEYNI